MFIYRVLSSHLRGDDENCRHLIGCSDLSGVNENFNRSGVNVGGGREILRPSRSKGSKEDPKLNNFRKGNTNKRGKP